MSPLLPIDTAWSESDGLWGTQGQQLLLLWLYYLHFAYGVSP